MKAQCMIKLEFWSHGRGWETLYSKWAWDNWISIPMKIWLAVSPTQFPEKYSRWVEEILKAFKTTHYKNSRRKHMHKRKQGVPQKSRHRFTIWSRNSTPASSQKLKTWMQTDACELCSQRIIHNNDKWKQSKCPST